MGPRERRQRAGTRGRPASSPAIVDGASFLSSHLRGQDQDAHRSPHQCQAATRMAGQPTPTRSHASWRPIKDSTRRRASPHVRPGSEVASPGRSAAPGPAQEAVLHAGHTHPPRRHPCCWMSIVAQRGSGYHHGAPPVRCSACQETRKDVSARRLNSVAQFLAVCRWSQLVDLRTSRHRRGAPLCTRWALK